MAPQKTLLDVCFLFPDEKLDCAEYRTKTQSPNNI